MSFKPEYYPGGVGLKGDFSDLYGDKYTPTKIYTGLDALAKSRGYTDDWYWQAIEKYKDDPEAYSYLSSNPYLFASNAAFSPTAWQSVMQGFGDYSAFDSYYGGLLNNSRQFLTDWEKKMYEQKYNSPVEQVAREKAAGLNPDLSPSSINPGSASENDQPFSPYSMPGAEQGQQLAQSFANFGLQFVSGILSFGKQIQDLDAGSSARVTAELGSFTSARDYVLNQLAGISDADLKNPSAVLKNIDLSIFSSKTRKMLNSYIQRFDGSDTNGGSLALATELAEYRNRMLRANSENASIMSSPYYDPDLNKWTSSIMDNFSKYVAAAEKYQAITSMHMSDVEATAYGDESIQNAYGRVIASELNAREDSAVSTSEAAKYKAEMDKTWNELEKVVKGDGDHWYNTIGVILLNFLRAQVSQPLSVGFSSASGVSPKGSFISRSFHF